MARLSDLVSILEEHRVDTAATLNLFARRLREAGRVSKAKRGRGAAEMTYLDAARFLIACAATDHPERAADAEYEFSNTMRSDGGWIDSRFDLTPETAPTLDVAVATMLQAIADDTIDAIQRAEDDAEHKELVRTPAIFWLVVRRSHVSASVRILNGQYTYHHPTLQAAVAAPDYLAQRPLLEALERDTYRFRTGKNLTAEFDAPLLRAVANLIAGNANEA